MSRDESVKVCDVEIKKLAEAFYNDTYLFDQNACSAPHTIFWLKSDNLDAAKKRFWTAVHEYTSKKHLHLILCLLYV